MRVFLFSRRWRRSAILALVCLLAATCGGEKATNPEADASAAGNVRVTEPMLSGFERWHRCLSRRTAGTIVAQSVCGPPTVPADVVSIVNGGCRSMRNMTDAIRVLAYAPECTDAAVEKLDEIAKTRREAEVLSNLAAAYYIRAQRKDQPSDLVRALDAADAATELAPESFQARFNRALAEEALRLSDEAVRSWDDLRRGSHAGWTQEAGERSARLTSKDNGGKPL